MLALYYYWVNQASISRGTSATGLAILIGGSLATGLPVRPCLPACLRTRAACHHPRQPQPSFPPPPLPPNAQLSLPLPKYRQLDWDAILTPTLEEFEALVMARGAALPSHTLPYPAPVPVC